MGILGLDNLVYFAENHLEWLLKILNSNHEFPFACCGINLTKTMFELLGFEEGINPDLLEKLHTSDKQWNSTLMSFFCCSNNLNAFEEIYCQLFVLFSEKFSQMKAGYMVKILETIV